MKKFFKSLVISLAMIGLVASTSFANGVVFEPAGFYEHSQTGAIKWKDKHPAGQSEWNLIKEVNADVGIYVNPVNQILGDKVIADGTITDWAGGVATANVTLEGEGFATGADGWAGYYRPRFVAGWAYANGSAILTMKSFVDIDTNGVQQTGTSHTDVLATSSLDINGWVYAKGNDGNIQSVEMSVEGSLSSIAWGNSKSVGPNGSFAQAGGSGITTTNFFGIETDYSTHGGWFSSNKALVDFNSNIIVNQEFYSESFVSPNGDTSRNYAFVGGGDAKLTLGYDGIFGRDNIDLKGIQAKGEVLQSGMATNGLGSYASGNSSASFSGAVGNISTISGWRIFPSPGQTANVNGYATVSGYNNVVTTPSSVTVTSIQSGYATTGNTAPAPQ